MYAKQQILTFEQAGALITESQLSVEKLVLLRGQIPDDLLDLMIKKAEVNQQILDILISYHEACSKLKEDVKCF